MGSNVTNNLVSKQKFRISINKLIKFICLIVLIYIVIKLINFWFKGSTLCDQLVLGKMNVLILLFTFLAIIWYTLETRKLRIASEHGIRLSLTPYVHIKIVNYHTEIHACNHEVKVVNVGSGLAVDISIKPQHSQLVTMEPLRFLKSGEEIEHLLQFNRLPFDGSEYDIKNTNFEHSFTVIYMDIENQCYETICKLILKGDNHSITVESQKRIVNN